MIGSFGSWASSFARNFTTREEMANVLNTKLEDFDSDDRHYVARYFFSRLPVIMTEERERRRAVRAISWAILEQEDGNLRSSLIAWVRGFPIVWQTEFAEALISVSDPSNPAVLLDDGTPFLSLPAAGEDGDIPF